MKKLMKFLALLLFAPLFMVSCEKNDVDNPEGGLKPFTVAVSGTTVDDVIARVQYDTKATALPYVIGVVAKDYYEANLSGKNDEALADYIVDAIEEEDAESTVVDNKYVFKGDANAMLSENWDFEANKEYYVTVFAVDSKGKLLTNVEKTLTNRLLAEEGSVAGPFAKFVSSTCTSMTVDIDMNGYEGNYLLFSTTKESFDKDYSGITSAVAIDFIGELKKAEYNFTEADGRFIFDAAGEIDLSKSWKFVGDTEYVVYAVGIDDEGNTTTSISTLVAETADFPLEDVELTVESTSINDIVLSATNPTDNILVLYAMEKTQYDGLGLSPKQYVEPILYTYEQNEIDVFEGAAPYSFIGAADNVSLKTGFQMKVDTEYVVMAFIIDEESTLLSDVTYREVSTDEYVEPQGELASISIENVTYFNCEATVDAGDYTGNYYLTIYLKDQLESDFGGDINKMADWMMEYELGYGTDFSVTNDRWVFNGDLNGFVMGDGGWSILDGEEYYVFAFGVSPYGDIVTKIVQSELIQTPSIGDLTFEVSLDEITTNGVTASFVPSIDDVPYFTWVYKTATIENMTDDELYYMVTVENARELLLESTTGETSRTMTDLMSNENYSVICFGYYPSEGRLTEVSRTPFTTLEGGEEGLTVPEVIVIPDVEFGSIAFDSFTEFSFYVTVTPNDTKMDWLAGYMSAAEYAACATPEEVIKKHLDQMYAKANKEFSEYLWWECFNGEKTPSFFNSTPGEYVAFAYGIDVDTAQPTTKLATVEVVRPEATEVAPFMAAPRATYGTRTEVAPVASKKVVEEPTVKTPALQFPASTMIKK